MHTRLGLDHRSLAVSANRRALTAEGLLPVLLIVGLVYTALAPLRPLQEPGWRGLVVCAVGGTVGAVFLLGRLACRRASVRAFVLRQAHEVALALCVLASLDSFAGTLVTGKPDNAGAAVMFMVAAGTLTYHRRYAAVVIGLCLAEWCFTALAHDGAGDWAPLTLMVVASAVVAAVLNTCHLRTADRLVRAQEAVRRAAVTDELTGLANRRGLLAAGRRLLLPHSSGETVDVDVDLSILFLDVDGLKDANDRNGHAAGDQLLRATAQALLASVRPTDTVARVGGDEFAVLLADATAEQVTQVRDRVQRALTGAGVAASMGVVRAAPGQTVEEVLDRADTAMYLVKQDRRTRGVAGRTARSSTGVRAAPVRPAALDEPAWVEPAHVQAAADLRSVSTAMAAVYAAFVPVHLLMLPGAEGRLMAACGATVVVSAAAVRAAADVPRLRSRVERHARLLLALLLLLACAANVLWVGVSELPWTSTAVMLGVIAAGALLESWRAAALVGLATALGWVAVAPGHGLAAGWAPYAVDVATSVAVAGLLHVVHAATIRRLTGSLVRLRTTALTDELTGLPNRRGFLAAGREVVDRASPARAGTGVLLLDLDGLKHVNDTRGHAAGDRLLVAAAGVLQQATAPPELCGRLGGDEFAVLLPDCPPDDVPARSRQLVEALEARRVAVSIGAAHLDPDTASLEVLIDRADLAMYRVKRDRRSAAPAVPS
ncbi:MAG TPA: GGDEF domain-containing protein [Mycobacteriales bacterium]|jgi:diguanylate cyclase (GGDEF)-like protein|nr:GGDEF domain-containing protein [Mycobacteriales bacterium]